MDIDNQASHPAAATVAAAAAAAAASTAAAASAAGSASAASVAASAAASAAVAVLLQILKNICRAGKVERHRVVQWFAAVLSSNEARAKAAHVHMMLQQQTPESADPLHSFLISTPAAIVAAVAAAAVDVDDACLVACVAAPCICMHSPKVRRLSHISASCSSRRRCCCCCVCCCCCRSAGSELFWLLHKCLSRPFASRRAD